MQSLASIAGKEQRFKAVLLWSNVRWTVLALIPFLSCSEQLPSYADPSHILRATFDSRYILIASENTVHIDLVVTNVFDETLQANGVLAGKGTITLKRNPAVHRSFSLGPSDLVRGRYDAATGVLTLNPGESVALRFVWNFVDDSGNDLTTTQFAHYPDPACSQRMIASEETFLLEGHISVFDRVQSVDTGPVDFSMCHVNFYVPPNACPSIDTSKPCAP